MINSQGNKLCQLILPPFQQGSTHKKEFAPFRSKFFPLRIDPVLEGLRCVGNVKMKSRQIFLFV